MTYHYQRAANDHGNATKIMRCSKHYDIRNHPYNHRPHKMNRTIWFLHHILSCGMYKFSEKDGITFLYAHRHIALTMISLTAGNCSSTLSNTITGNHVHRNCILLCKLTVCTSLTVFLCMWLTRIFVIWFQTSDRMYQTCNICPSTDRNCNYCVITAYHTVWEVIFLFL